MVLPLRLEAPYTYICEVEAVPVAVMLVVVALRAMSPPLKVCCPVQVLTCVRSSEAVTAPVVGEMARVPSELETEVTPPAPRH